MRPTLSLMALIAGMCLIYMGYQRQQSLEGKAAATLAKIGRSVDGGDHMPTHVKYYIAGAVLAIGGAVGLGLVKK
jgi:drug/metabolite transporter (DMT)-like permease